MEQHFCEEEVFELDCTEEEFNEALDEGCAVFGHTKPHPCGQPAVAKHGRKWYCAEHEDRGKWVSAPLTREEFWEWEKLCKVAERIKKLEQQAEKTAWYESQGAKLELTGSCPRCRHDDPFLKALDEALGKGRQ